MGNKLAKIVGSLLPGTTGGPLQLAILCSLVVVGFAIYASPRLNNVAIEYVDNQKYGVDTVVTGSIDNSSGTEQVVPVKRYTIRKSVLDE